ncbi:hypothetical protein V2J09_011202 [Rumex salicifolius]
MASESPIAVSKDDLMPYALERRICYDVHFGNRSRRIGRMLSPDMPEISGGDKFATVIDFLRRQLHRETLNFGIDVRKQTWKISVDDRF